MTRERRDRIEEIANAISGFRRDLITMRLAEIHALPFVNEKAMYELSCEYITELRKAADLFADGLRELGY